MAGVQGSVNGSNQDGFVFEKNFMSVALHPPKFGQGSGELVACVASVSC